MPTKEYRINIKGYVLVKYSKIECDIICEALDSANINYKIEVVNLK